MPRLIDLNFLDITNVMALRGDAIPGQKYFIPEVDGHKYSCDFMTYESILAKLMWILGQTKDEEEIKKLFYKSINYDLIG